MVEANRLPSNNDAGIHLPLLAFGSINLGNDPNAILELCRVVSMKGSLLGLEVPKQLESMPCDLEPLFVERFGQMRIEFFQEMRIERGGQVAKLTGPEAAEVIMGIAAAIKPRGPARVRKLGGQI